MKPVRLVRSFLTVGFWTLASRILGLARDMMLAAYLGAGPVYEAFVVALSLPNLFRRFFAEGAFNMAFVPMFAKRLEEGDAPLTFARTAFAGLASVLVVLTLIAMPTMPWLVHAMASGFAEDERGPLAVQLARITFPYILLISLAALVSGVLNSAGRFAAAAAAPVLLNVFFIATLLLGQRLGWPLGMALAWAVPLAGVAQLALVWVAAARIGLPITPTRPRLTPEMWRLLQLMGPALLAGGVVQINLLVGRQVASYTPGAVVWLFNADRLYQLPLGVVGIAIGIVLLPELARRLQAGDDAGGRHALSRANEFALTLTVPAAVALVVIAGPLVAVLFGRGAYGATDVANTALALAIYGAGLPAFVLQKTLQPLYYAREDTRRPFRFAVVAMLTNAAIAIGLMPVLGFAAAALATTLAGWIMVLQLWLGSRPMGEVVRMDARLQRRWWRICLAATVMGGVLGVAQLALAGILAMPGWRIAGLGLLVLGGMVVYFATGLAIDAFDRRDLGTALRRRR